MKPENEMNEEVRQLLDCLEEHGKNARRQKELGDLIDRLADEEKAVTMPRKHRKLTPLWWVMGVAAACLLLWLLVKPNAKQQPEMEQEILVEETKAIDSVKTEVNDAVFEQPVANEAFLAEETPVVPQNDPMKKEKPKTQIIEKVIEQPMLAEVTPSKPEDTANTRSNTIPASIEEHLSPQSSPQRRVIRSLNLVCYECQVEQVENEGWESLDFHLSPLTSHLSPFPKDPNMKNGSLVLEIKLN